MGNCCCKTVDLSENSYSGHMSPVGVENICIELDSLDGVESEEIYVEIKGTNVKVRGLSQYSVIAAIDFGTTYSGYALAFNSSNTKIELPMWTGTEGMTYKAPTAVLFKPDKSFYMFGYEAVVYMQENPNGEDLEKFYFFHDFKMLLYQTEKISLQTEIQDVTGEKSLPAIVVFSSVIRYFTDHLKSNLSNRFGKPYFAMSDTFWVLTVPAIWTLKAKYFMREAAEQSGIPVGQLTIALEPEVASVLCRNIDVYVLEGDDMEGVRKSPCSIPDNSTYLVVDIGGGTVDITLHQVLPGRGLCELYQASGGDFGGNKVNRRFLKFITELFGEDVIKAVKQKQPSNLVEIDNNFEHKKKANTKLDDEDKIVIKLPFTFVQEYMTLKKTTFQQRIKDLGYEGQIDSKYDKLILKCKLFKSFFECSFSGIKKCIESALEHGSNTNTIMVVGGFAESPYLVDMLRKHFCNYKVLVPEDSSLVVLKGAVLFGFDSTIIQSRKCRYSYGIANQRPFIAGKDKEEKKRKHDGRYYCDDVFDKHVEIGEMLQLGKFQEPKDYHPVNADQVNIMLELYASTEQDPIYVDDPSCHLVGVMEIQVKKRKPGEDGTVLVSVNFSGTELEIKAVEKKTGNVITSTCNFLG